MSVQEKFDPKMLEALVCPLTQSVLEYNEEKQELISKSAGLAYPIRSGIPIMLADEARVLDCINVGKSPLSPAACFIKALFP